MDLTKRTRKAAAVMSLAACCSLAGCAVGPNFHRPAAPHVEGYDTAPLPAQTAAADIAGGATQRLVSGADVRGDWWALFQSPALDELIEQALKANPDVAAAKAALRKAHEVLAEGYASLVPDIDAQGAYSREKISGGVFGAPNVGVPPFSLSSASLNVSYLIDVFGGARREIESLKADADQARFQREAAVLTLTSNVVTTAVNEAALAAQVQATEAIIADERNVLTTVRAQADAGAVSGAAVVAEESQLATTEATLPPLKRQLAAAHYALAALAGEFPSENTRPAFSLAALTLPQEIPVSVPSRLVEQRPDIRAAEAALHSANAQIGVATAKMLPQLTLTGSYGSSTGDLSQLFSAGTGVWSLGGSLAQPLLSDYERLHERRAAVAARDQAAEQYRSTVISAFEQVANALKALETDADALKAQDEAARAARANLDIVRQQYLIGTSNYILLLDAQRTDRQAQVNLVAAQAARYADTAALFAALGGGWWNRPDIDAPHQQAAASSTTKQD